MDCIPPGSSVYWISQTKILEWVAISFFRGSSPPRDQTRVFCIGRQILYLWATGKAKVHSKRLKRAYIWVVTIAANLDSIFKSRDITLPTKVLLVKAMVFPVVMYDVRVGLSAKELMLLNCGVGEDCWESLGLQGDPISPFWRRSALGFLWKEWC